MNKKEFNQYVSNVLKDCRNKKGFTQSDMAKSLKVTQSTIAGFESGNQAVSTETIRKYSEILVMEVNINFKKPNKKVKINE